MGENVTNVFGLNLCQLKKDAYPNRFCFGPFHFVLAVPSKIISPQEFTQTLCWWNFVPKGRNFDSLIFDSQVVEKGSKARPALSMVLLEQIRNIRLQKTAQHWETWTKGKCSFSTNPLSPTIFQETYFPCSLDSALQILNRGREQAYETRSGASQRQQGGVKVILKLSNKNCDHSSHIQAVQLWKVSRL